MKNADRHMMDKKRFFLFLSFMFILAIANSNTINKDSLKSKYDLNDPRNPNCPCHKHQKLADEEYKNWLRGRSRETGIAVSKLDVRDDRIKQSSSFRVFKMKIKRRTKAHPVFKKVFDFKRYKLWSRVTDTNACFKWKK